MFNCYSAVNPDKNMVFIGKTNFTALKNISLKMRQNKVG